jgi:lysophospholipase L1-like esterase
MQMRNQWVALVLSAWLVMLGALAQADDKLPKAQLSKAQLPDVQRVVFLGDSITHAGAYVTAIETALIMQSATTKMELLNLGLPSETVSGLSEPGHAGGQFPRPVLSERLDRILAQTKPDLVVACYGMNDGIYYPNNDERFGKFKSGMEQLHSAVESAGANIIHLTPAYFDALPIQDRLLPAGLEHYPQPYEKYDDVLEDYSRWLMSQCDKGWVVLDLHSAMKRAVMERRKTDPKFTFASDGVHPNAEGQAIIAGPLAEHWGLKMASAESTNLVRLQAVSNLVSQKQSVLKHAWLTSTGHLRPGIEKGLPIAEAEAKATDLDRQARAIW